MSFVQWPYRSQSLCCNVCKYSSQSIHNFRNHVSRCHADMHALCSLASCSQCVFIGHPRIVKKHIFFFHSSPAAVSAPARRECYKCRKCAFPSASVFNMKKHIILKHLEHLAEQYIGYRLNEQGKTTTKIYCCKVCRVNTGTLDQMLHHMLVEPSHYSVNAQVQSLICENKNYTIKSVANGNNLFVTFPSIAPKTQTPQIFSGKSLVLPSNGQAAGTVLALQQVSGATNSATLICTPGSNQAFLPPQASALVQLASAEAKGLLRPGATIALQSALPHGPSVVQLPTVSNVTIKQAPVTLTPAQPQQTLKPQNILLPSALQANVAAGPATVPKLGAVANNAANLKGTMLTSQSLLSHLIPTGNRVNGLPTYTFAPLQVAVPTSQSPTLKAAEQINPSTQAKKWITCPFCNELFPSNVFDLHAEVAHQTKSKVSSSENVAARAAFLKKMPDKTMKCLTCKILVSEKSIFQHLLHGLSCLHCSALFFSIKQLVEHIKQHNPTSKAYCDFLRQKYKIHSKNVGGILFPRIDFQTSAPKEILGDVEVNLALVTNSLELMYFKLQAIVQPEICPAAVKINSSFCPFCDEKFQSESRHIEHLKQKHFVAPTIHAILKTEAFKCIYCNGVYTGKVTQQAVMLHIQRCRCSPKPSQPPKAVAAPQPQLKPVQPPSQPSGLYFLQVPQGMTVKQTLVSAPVIPKAQPTETDAERESKRRLEAALKQAIEANAREREHKAAMRKRREQEKVVAPPEAAVPVEPPVKLLAEPSQQDSRSSEERKDFISKYFNLNPYVTRVESEELCKRLSLTKAELAALFSKKRSRCMKSLKRNTAAILLGFNMTELGKVKHNLFVPAPHPADSSPTELVEKGGDGPERMENENERVGEGEQVE